jgi:hypothetical protein
MASALVLHHASEAVVTLQLLACARIAGAAFSPCSICLLLLAPRTTEQTALPSQACWLPQEPHAGELISRLGLAGAAAAGQSGMPVQMSVLAGVDGLWRACCRVVSVCVCVFFLAASRRAPPAACWLIALAGQSRAVFAAPAKGTHVTAPFCAAWSMLLLLCWAFLCVVPSSLAWGQVFMRQGWRHLPRATLPDGIMGVPVAAYAVLQLQVRQRPEHQHINTLFADCRAAGRTGWKEGYASCGACSHMVACAVPCMRGERRHS